MSDDTMQCSTCGLPQSDWMDGLCPVCLLGLGDATGDSERMVDEVPRRLGDYEILEPIARGGMGVVYRARQVSLNRQVAVKVLLGGRFASETFLKRFQREAEAAASLSHPHIVPIYEVGEHDGQPYFSMELIEGQSLAELSRGNPMPIEQAVRLLKTLADAVHFAHQRGVLHRDLKPSNILVDHEGRPHISDFGLAKRVEEDAELTLPGQVMGSPNYLAPEQAASGSEPLGRGGDLYSLGAILYHLITGRPPHLADTVAQTLRLAVETEPVSPRLLNPSVSRDLETISLKCLEKAPARRYTSAEALAEELGRWLRKEPIHARPVGWAGRLLRWCRRKPALATAIGSIILLLAVGGMGASVAMFRIQHERDVAEDAGRQEAILRLRAESAERKSRAQLYEALLGEARATVRSGELGQRLQTLQAVRRAAEITNTVELRREAIAAMGLPDLRFEREIPIGPGTTLALLDPGFTRLATSDGTNGVQIRAALDSQLLFTLPERGDDSVLAGRWSQDGRYLGVQLKPKGSSSPLSLRVWEVNSQRELHLFPATPFGAFAFHPSRPQVLTDDGDNTVSLWDLEKDERLMSYAIPGTIHHLGFSPDGQTFVVQHRVQRPWFTSLHEVASGKVLKSRLTAWVDSFAWDPKDRWIVFGARNGEVHLYDRKSEEAEVLGRLKNSVRGAVLTPDGNYLFAGSEEREIGCWDLRTRRRVMTVPLPGAQMLFQSGGRRWATVTRTGVRLYAPELETPYRELVGELGRRLRYAAFSPDGRWLAASGLSRLGVWDLQRPEFPAFPLEDEQARPVFSGDSQELCAHSQRRLALWRIETSDAAIPAAPRLKALSVPTVKRVFSAEYTTNHLVLGTDFGVLRLPRGGQPSEAARSPYLSFVRGAVSPDGEVVAARRYREIEMYRSSDWLKVGSLEFDGELLSHAFSPDGRELAVASEMGVTFLDVNDWKAKRKMSLPLGKGGDLIFERRGKNIWVIHDALEASLHEGQTFETLLSLPLGHVPRALSADGRQLAVVVDSERLQVWDFSMLRRQLAELGVDWVDR